MGCTARAVEALLARYLGARRRAHCRAVARLAARLCRRFGLDPQQGRLAGLAHDLARELPADRLLELAAAEGGVITQEERERPVLLHGRAGAALLRREVGGCDPEVYQAVADHVTGRAGMGRLAKIVYAADFLAAGRRFVDPGTRARILRLDLDAMVGAVLERVFEYLGRGGIPLARNAAALYDELGEHADAQAQMG
ncbi:MAG: bis(5'-nucleosyl)-tetraphosphatase (symmetrical) YqeK [Spirochaetales bacterium]|nr:bis(5'-nucleosyl)-tetraphosphatase (symmetrical) YqeK [Spirochaetales bacterium]